MSFWKSYSSLILLLIGLTAGSLIGIIAPEVVGYLKPMGDIFLNLLFITVIPLVFFAIVNSIISIGNEGEIGKILGWMSATFLLFIVSAALFTLLVVYLFPTEAPDVTLIDSATEMVHQNTPLGEQITNFFSVGEFYLLFSREHMLALLIFSFLLGITLRRIPREKTTVFCQFISGAYEAMTGLLMTIMKVAPIGLGAYIAYQVGTVGPQLFGFYAKPLGLYYATAAAFFLIGYSVFTFLSTGPRGFKAYWRHNAVPSLTAISTCSSLATMPVVLEAAKKTGVPKSVANIVVTIGSTIHKDGSSISSIIKIYVVFLIMGWDLFTVHNLIIALVLTIFVSLIEGGVPSGGYVGEILMIGAYNLPPEAIPAVMIIGTLVDPLATVLNSVGNSAAAMVVTRLTGIPWEPQQ